jgi:EAL domain-containing protein (putative c-di-GMP-specific phosphodiesterase class I)
MPVDDVKIDQSFVARLGTAAGDALLDSVVNLAHSIGAHVIAEGVEIDAQLAGLRATACDSAAGGICSPGPARRRTSPGAARSGRTHPLSWRVGPCRREQTT